MRIHRILFMSQKTKPYDVIGVNVFLRKIMRFPRMKGVNLVPIPLLETKLSWAGGLFVRRDVNIGITSRSSRKQCMYV